MMLVKIFELIQKEIPSGMKSVQVIFDILDGQYFRLDT